MDKRAQESTKAGGFKSKVRIPSTPSTLLPPADAPKWCVIEVCSQSASTPTPHMEITTPLSATPHRVEQSDMQGASTPAHSSSVTIHDNSVNVTTPIATPRASRQVRLDLSSRSSPMLQSPVTINDNSATIVTPLASSASSRTSCYSDVVQQLSESNDDSYSSSSDSLSSD